MGFFSRHRKRWSQLTGSSSDSGGAAAPAVGPSVISEDHVGLVGFRLQTVNVSEGQVAHLMVERFGGSAVAVTVQWTSYDLAGDGQGRAINGVHWVGASGTLSWAAGDSTPKFIDIQTIAGTGYDQPRQFYCLLTVSTGAPLGYFKTQTVVITDVATLGVGPCYFRPESTSYSVLENGTSLTVSVARLGSLTGAASIDANAVNGTALSGTHYTDTPATLSWADGEGGAKTFDVTIINVGGAGGDKIFYVDLTAPVGGTIDDVYDQITCTIIDDEGILVVPGRIDIQAAVNIAESASGTNVILTRTLGSAGALTVTYSIVSGTAISGADFVAGAGTISWADGDYANKQITFTPIDNSLIRTDKTCFIVLSNLTGGATLGNATCAISILEDDRVSSMTAGQIGLWEGATLETNTDWGYTHMSVLVRPIGLVVSGEVGPSRPSDSNGQASDILAGGYGEIDSTPTGGFLFQLI